MIHVYVVIVHSSVNELVLLFSFSDLPNAVTVAVLLNLDSVHLHLKGIMYMSDIIPGALYETSMDKVKLLMNIESAVVDPVVIITIECKFGPEPIGSGNIGCMLI